MKKITVTINQKQLVVEQSFRSLMEFEKMTGKNAYEVNTSVTDSMTLFYCMLKAANRETFQLSFDEFLTYLDTHPETLDQFNSYIMSLANPEQAVADKKKAEKR